MNRFIVVDLETTGNNPEIDHIIQIGAVLIEDHEIKDSYSSFVYTDKEIPPFIQKLTGIKNSMLKDAPTLEQVVTDILPLMDNAIFVAHNAAFDLGFIQATFEKMGYLPFSGLVLDTLTLSRILLPMAQSYKLTQITEELEIIHENPHRAEDDALATANLFIQLIEELEDMPLVYLQRLFDIVKTTHPDLSILIEEMIESKYNSFQEEDEDQYTIINQFALQRTDEEHEEGADFEAIDFETMFDEEGLLFYNFPDFELRDAQKTMAKEVREAFIDHAHLMVEAGTGTGKSLAYLLPSIYWAKENDEKIVIATHTINLQEQLFQRDIPLLKKILPFSFSATILKGRNNYLCLRKFEQLVTQYDNFDFNMEHAVDIAQLLSWVVKTKTGDVEEINLSVTGRNIWSQIRSDADSCLNRHCPWFRSCFYHRARHNAQAAEIIITNHSLLLTNIKTDHRILPAYHRLVIDEAHQFEDIASKHLGYEINQYQINGLIQRFYKDAKSGFLVSLANELLSSQDPDQANIANKINNQLFPLISAVETSFGDYFIQLGNYVNNRMKNSRIDRRTLRMTKQITGTSEWQEIIKLSGNIYVEFTEWINQMDEIYTKLTAIDFEESRMVDLNGHIKDLKETLFIFSEWNHVNDENMVFWIETVTRGRKIFSFLYAAPIEIGPFVKEYLFDKMDSIILTSATLTVNDSFSYSSRAFGFSEDDDELRRMSLPSPFDYKEQVNVFIPKDIPNIQEVKEDAFIDHIAKNIADMAISLNGKMLVLFTSHLMLKKTYDLLKPLLEPFQIKVLGHGIDSNSRTKLTKRFAENSQTILLGTNSFWEGVDVPGEALSALVIVRLPFTPPNHPIHEAKTEKLKMEQRNPFIELSVPQAVIRFKQGFGRLIRTKKDYGVVIIFDRRIVESRYGKAFIKSLPDVDVVYQPFDQIMEKIDKWAISMK